MGGWLERCKDTGELLKVMTGNRNSPWLGQAPGSEPSRTRNRLLVSLGKPMGTCQLPVQVLFLLRQLGEGELKWVPLAGKQLKMKKTS